jgi:hypothetical protein
LAKRTKPDPVAPLNPLIEALLPNGVKLPNVSVDIVKKVQQ